MNARAGLKGPARFYEGELWENWDMRKRHGCVEAKRELLELRTQQAIRRDSSLRPLLEPQLELIDEIYRNVGRASTCLGQYHTVREQHGW
jgi:ribosomal protein L29